MNSQPSSSAAAAGIGGPGRRRRAKRQRQQQGDDRLRRSRHTGSRRKQPRLEAGTADAGQRRVRRCAIRSHSPFAAACRSTASSASPASAHAHSEDAAASRGSVPMPLLQAQSEGNGCQSTGCRSCRLRARAMAVNRPLLGETTCQSTAVGSDHERTMSGLKQPSSSSSSSWSLQP